MGHEKFLTLLFAGSTLAVAAQENPFEEFGYTPKIATLSGGKYIEYFDRDTLVQIGALLYNTKAGKIAGFVVEDTSRSEATLVPDVVSRWISPDPMAYMRAWVSPYNFVQNNPINRVDPNGALDDWVENANGEIYWDNNATSQATTKAGETYLGKNVLVGTHNRDQNLNEPINSAQFDLYLESNKQGPSATIKGNTVPADVTKAGTLAEGIYSARFGHRNQPKYQNELAIRIYNLNGKDGLPTVNGNPNPQSDGKTLTGVLFHMGNNYQKSLFDSRGTPYSTGCQTSGCYPNSLPAHEQFMKTVGTDFQGTYYLRSKPVFSVPSGNLNPE